jgi:hypothetical protein
MSNLRTRVRALEEKFSQGDGLRVLDLIILAIAGDQSARFEFEPQRAARKIQGDLGELPEAPQNAELPEEERAL